MKSVRYLFPGGCRRALTLSYDDGVVEDRRLAEICNRHGIKCTFHLNGGWLGYDGRIAANEAAELYRGHEISCHSFDHPYMERLPEIAMLHQVIEDRRVLEAVAGYPVRGMSYPMGTWDGAVKNALAAAGIAYSRTTVSTGGFGLPKDWLEWHPTCHHREDCLTRLNTFLETWCPGPTLFYLWGHSYEFERNGNWELIEEFCRAASGREDLWYATNIEIYDYLTAGRRLEFGCDMTMVRNPTAGSVWLEVDEGVCEIPGGALVRL